MIRKKEITPWLIQGESTCRGVAPKEKVFAVCCETCGTLREKPVVLAIGVGLAQAREAGITHAVEVGVTRHRLSVFVPGPGEAAFLTEPDQETSLR